RCRSPDGARGWGWRLAESILTAAGFGYRYPERDAPALEDVTLELAPGSFTVLAGRSGSGKSTLLRAACGLVPHFHGGEAWGVLVAEHRLERCLPAADRLLALDGGRIVCDASPADFLDWAVDADPGLATPAATLFSLAGLGPLPVSVKQARDALDAAGLAPRN